jgi:hypothetical protein
MAADQLFFNGINGITGDYGLPPMTGEELSGFIRGERKPENLDELRFRARAATERTLGVKEGVDPKKLDQAGWGIVFAHDADPAVKEALTGLITLRKTQAGDHFRLYNGPDGYRRDKDTKGSFLARHGAGPGPADPDKVPYYLLIVGSPEAIPYKFQYELDVQYAVGRIHFDTLQEYANYAASVVAAEKDGVKLPRRATFFGVANPGDGATKLSSTELIEPLGKSLAAKNLGWQIENILREEAVKARLKDLLGGPRTPALLMTAGHGMEFPLNDREHLSQLPHQGALLCQDWPGRAAWGRKPISRDFYFAGDDLTGGENLLGLLAFFFACYGAGTPQLDEFSKQAFKDRMPIAPYPFIATLPKKMLGHPRGGALAVIGHIERAWTFSFHWPNVGAQTTVFESTLQRLLDGHPVGSALEYFNERWAELATVLSDELEEIDFGRKFDPFRLADMWTANNDARSYVIIGDPAVRLTVGDKDALKERPVIKPVEIREQAVSAPERPAEPGGQPEKPSATKTDQPGATSFLPQPEPDEELAAMDPELYKAWQKHIIAGFEHNEEMFRRVLDAFMRPYQTTVWMYRILFGIGIISFLFATGMSAWTKEAKFGLIFGGLGVIAFLSYFISRPLQALEQNLQFITWLGVVYNSYWARLASMKDQATVQKDLLEATRDATSEIEKMIAKHAEVSGKRPGLTEK